MTDNYQILDLDAGRREAEYPDGIEVHLRGEAFVLPAELPLDVFGPFLTDKVDISDLVRAIAADDDDSGASVGDLVTSALTKNPRLLMNVWDAIHESMAILFGDDEYARFRQTRPSIPAYIRLVRGLFDLYGTTLGEAFASPDSSEDGGATSKETSVSTPESTPGKSGAARARNKAS